AVLRAEKSWAAASEAKRELLLAVVKVCSFNATEIAGTAAKRGAFYVEEGDTLSMILSGVRRFAKYDASGLLQAVRLLSKRSLEEEKYLF
ncbi:MAG: acyl-CoA dehydrogenase, partial [Geopsychrobacter sp.]|nr:acyl-CoA dehydrogenase [Geopsychrobacter sp.]